MAGRLMLAFLLCLPGVALAQSADPTRPAIDTGMGASAGMTAPQSIGSLQSIIQRKTGKPAALINGTLVELGARVGEARLAIIGDDFVELRGPAGKEILRLTPAVDKKLVRKNQK